MNGKGYKVILILVVGLTAFSSAIKELNQMRQLGLEVNQFVAEWSAKLMPAEVPPPPAPVVARLSTCESKQSEPMVDLPWVEHAAEANENNDIEETEVAAPPVVTKRSTNRAKRERSVKVDPVQFEVRVLNEQVGTQELPAVPGVSDFPMSSTTFKFRNRRQSFNFKINPRDREILKTLNRSINLRTAG